MVPGRKGLVHVYTGNGKGKTTAALGLALRALGHGFRIHIIQFMKGNINYGELRSIAKIEGITLVQGGREDFVNPDDPDPIDLKLATPPNPDDDAETRDINLAGHNNLQISHLGAFCVTPYVYNA